MILFLHHRYRTTGGEERAVADLRWLVETRPGEPTALLTRDSAGFGRAAAAAGLVRRGTRGAPLRAQVFVVPHVVRSTAAAPAGGDAHALVASRLAPEK